MACACLVVAAMSASVSGQSDAPKRRASDNTQVKDDPFSGAATITLPPQTIVNDVSIHLVMTAEAKILGSDPERGVRPQDDNATVTFTSRTPAGFDFGDSQLHFLVDGEPVRIGYAGLGRPVRTSDKILRVSEKIVTVAPLTKLQRVASGSDVHMRLGQLKVPVEAKVLSALRRFLDACRHQNTKRNVIR